MREKLTYVGDFGLKFNEAHNPLIVDNEYTWTDTGKIFFSERNIQFINKLFQDVMIKVYKINVGPQQEFFILEIMHEIFHHYMDMRYLKGTHSVMAALNRNKVKGYEYDPEKKAIDPINIKFDKQQKENTIHRLNKLVIKEMVDVARENIKNFLGYHKRYNEPVHVKKRFTNFAYLPQDYNFNVARKDALVNLKRVKPRMYNDNIPFRSLVPKN